MKKNIIVVNSKNDGWVNPINSTTYDTQIVEVENLGIVFEIIKLNNDIYGNPRVSVVAYKNYQEIDKENVTSEFRGSTGRFYKKNKKIITQCFETKKLVQTLVDFIQEKAV